MKKSLTFFLFLLSFNLSANDPFEEVNRSIYKFNKAVDESFARPVAEVYDNLVPSFIKYGISNFFDNIEEIDNSFNQLLQGKPGYAVNDFARFCVNTTIGLVGLVDVASSLGLDSHDEDFGQTLGVWGIPSGPYLMLPIFGPSSPRDLIGGPISSFLSGTFAVEKNEARISLFALNALDTRARLLDIESLVIGDEYSFIRDSYEQFVEYEVSDGIQSNDEFLDDIDDIFDD